MLICLGELVKRMAHLGKTVFFFFIHDLSKQITGLAEGNSQLQFNSTERFQLFDAELNIGVW